MRFSEGEKELRKEELVGEKERETSEQQQQTKEALFGAPCIPVIEEELCHARARVTEGLREGGRGTVTNETPSYSQRSFLPSFAGIITDLEEQTRGEGGGAVS